MKSRFFLIFFLSLGIVSVCQAQPSAAPVQVDMQAVVDSATTAFKAYTSLIRAGEFAKAADFYADDHRFIWVEDGSIKYDTRAQVKRALEGIGSMGPVENSYGGTRIWALNEKQVIVFTRFRTTIDKGTDKEVGFAGALTIVMELKENGWKFLSGHTSSTPASKGF